MGTWEEGRIDMYQPTPMTKLAAALLKAQKEIGAAKKGSTNPFFHSSYADLGSVMEACKEPLNNNGITVLQPVLHDEHGDYVETVLLHESGEYISDKMRLLPTADAQKQGSAISYARRYSLQSLVFIPSVDDDGESVTKHTETVSSPTTVSQGGGNCNVCRAAISKQVYDYSLEHYGVALCFTDQQKAKKVK